MLDESQQSEKKIIVDEDWKNRVQAEKEAAAHKEQEPAPQSPHPLPPADLTFLASTLYLQAMVSLGLLPHPMSEKPQVQLDQAKHSIDVLDVLYAKTAGNRTTDETEAMEQMLHELRMAYISVGDARGKKA
jgi:hypothetical protein